MHELEEWQLGTRLIGKRTLIFSQLDSTNTRAAMLATSSSDDGLAVLARTQTAGRGQHGRTWCCPPGAGVLLSVALFPPAALARPALLTAWAAVAVCDTIAQLANLEPQIKWPNDVLVGGKKIAGILIERGRSTVAGIGVNLNQTATDFALAGLPDATSVAIASGRSTSWENSIRLLISKLDEGYCRLLEGDHKPLEKVWQRHLGLAGKPVELECISGEIRCGCLLQCSFSGIILLGSDGLHTFAPESVRHITT